MFERVEDCAARMDLRDALHVLTPGQAIALRLWFTGYTHAEIGELEGVSRQAITNRVARAQATLRECSR
jgi:DNA-directed RNA polymerase specialized sigma24 family protein